MSECECIAAFTMSLHQPRSPERARVLACVRHSKQGRNVARAVRIFDLFTNIIDNVTNVSKIDHSFWESCMYLLTVIILMTQAEAMARSEERLLSDVDTGSHRLWTKPNTNGLLKQSRKCWSSLPPISLLIGCKELPQVIVQPLDILNTITRTYK